MPPFSQSAYSNSRPKMSWNNAFSVKPKRKNSQIKIIGEPMLCFDECRCGVERQRSEILGSEGADHRPETMLYVRVCVHVYARMCGVRTIMCKCGCVRESLGV